jgi:hypothetical protein
MDKAHAQNPTHAHIVAPGAVDPFAAAGHPRHSVAAGNSRATHSVSPSPSGTITWAHRSVVAPRRGAVWSTFWGVSPLSAGPISIALKNRFASSSLSPCALRGRRMTLACLPDLVSYTACADGGFSRHEILANVVLGLVVGLPVLSGSRLFVHNSFLTTVRGSLPRLLCREA